MSSLQTTLARAAARAAAAEWKSHRRFCPRCSMASRSRSWPLLCAEGARARRASLAAAGELAWQAELDRRPASGQETLW